MVTIGNQRYPIGNHNVFDLYVLLVGVLIAILKNINAYKDEVVFRYHG
jgi:hypothetical protein